MNKIHFIIEGVLAVCVLTLFILLFTLRPTNGSIAAGSAASATLGCTDAGAAATAVPIAYVNIDSVLVQYSFAQEANDKLMTKQEDARLKLNTKARTLQNEMADFQRKLENNAFLSRERAEQEQQRLIKKQQDLESLEAQLTQDLYTETQKLNLQLADSLMAFLNIYNADGRYQLILSNNAKDNVLMAEEQYDITPAVVEGLNARYKK